MADLGASGRIVGASLTVSTLSEIPFMFFSRGLLERFKARPLLLFALLIFVLRLVLYSFITVPWLLLPVQLFTRRELFHCCGSRASLTPTR